MDRTGPCSMHDRIILTGCGSSKKETEAETTVAESSVEETSAEETTANESEAAKSDLDKLVFTYVTSPLNVPTSSRRIRVFSQRTLARWELPQIMRS